MSKRTSSSDPQAHSLVEGSAVRILDAGPFQGEQGTFVELHPTNGWSRVAIEARQVVGRDRPVRTVVLVRQVEAVL